MSTTSAYLTVAGIDIDVIYKNIKNLHIAVYPPLGRVRVAAPQRLDDDAIRLAVVQRLPWIKRQREQLRSAVRQSEREMVSGETHYVWGRRYRLNVIEDSKRYTTVQIDGSRLTIHTPSISTDAERRAALDRWYRKQLKAAIPALIAKWEPIMGMRVNKWTVRRMRTKWGTCKAESSHITFNLELAKKDPAAVEYILVHEMCHFRERGHGDRFVRLMNSHMPDWQSRRDGLNDSPLNSYKSDEN